ncbi:CotH kinase family protein [Tepidimicrobium xylanilyticum]
MKKWSRSIYLSIFIIVLILIIKVNINDEPNQISKHIPIRRENCICSLDNNLPIIVIDTNGQKIEAKKDYIETTINDRTMKIHYKSPKYQAKLKLYEPIDGYTCICKEGSPTLETDILINVRGQSSLLNPKKQYTINFIDESGHENHLEILGLPKHDKWVLNGSYGDRSLIRNYLAYKMSAQVMEYVPRTCFVEVYLNDDLSNEITYESHYLGVYILTEKIEIGEKRINIKKNDDKYADISFIIARDKIKMGDPVLKTHWSQLEDDYIIDEYRNIHMRTVITVIYPGASTLTPELEERIVNYLNEFEYVLKSNYFNDRRLGYRRYIDVDSFVNFAMINEIFKNFDGGDVSTYFYKDIGGLMKAGPIWDFDLTLGNTTYESANEPTGFRMINTLWFDRLFQDPYFADRYRKVLYPYYRKTIWTTVDIDEGFNRGNVTEIKQGEQIVQLLDYIYKSGCIGAIIYSWQDDWSKTTAFNLMEDYSDESSSTYWYDVQASDESFGLMAFRPKGKEYGILIDGHFSDWDNINPISKNYDIRVTSDTSYFYLYFKKEGLSLTNATIYIGLDITPFSGSKYWENKVEFPMPVDFILELKGYNESRIVVHERYNIFNYLYKYYSNIIEKQENPPDIDSNIFSAIYLLNRKNFYFRETNTVIPPVYYETGKLVYGNANPNSSEYNSLADFNKEGDAIEIRIPWMLINIKNPLKRLAQGDFYSKGLDSQVFIKNIGLSICYEGKNYRFTTEKITYKIPSFKNIKYDQILKKSYYIIMDYWKDN